ncbi:MAG TPA: hydroxymethylbilane synthase [Aggregatilineales bacterium]|nr:hydroxymethylbilane synthase [Aggregatilineales bacterium]
MERLIIGTRGSRLAVWQAEYVARRLQAIEPSMDVSLKYFDTQGDRVQDRPIPQIGAKGLFTQELEEALRIGAVDLAVHSLKDLPTELSPQFVIGAVPERASVHDVLISRSGCTLDELPIGAAVGTSSLRRTAQLKSARPDLNILPLRGNVPARIEKALAGDGPYEAVVLAEAGLERLGLAGSITELLPTDVMLPAPAQGALAVQGRADDRAVLALVARLDHDETRLEVEAERAFLNRLDAGCRLPVAALARWDGASLRLISRVSSLDGTQVITVESTRPLAGRAEATAFGQQLAAEAIQHGADRLLDAVREGLTE